MTRGTARPKLVMTLLVRDESDIVGDNIAFHLAHGVDHVVATDNASTDGTREILADWAATGVLTLRDEPAHTYEQDVWTTRMATFARDRLDADWILPNDADEFWLPEESDLRESVAGASADLLDCKRANMLAPLEDLGHGDWTETLLHRPAQPPAMPRLDDIYADPLGAPYFYFALPPKVLLRTRGLRRIHRGAHNAVYDGRSSTRAPAGVGTYHFPIRTAGHFHRSVQQIGRAVRENPNTRQTTSWKYRRWLAMLEDGRSLESVLRDALPDRQAFSADVASGRLVRDTVIRDQLAWLRARSMAV